MSDSKKNSAAVVDDRTARIGQAVQFLKDFYADAPGFIQLVAIDPKKDKNAVADALSWPEAELEGARNFIAKYEGELNLYFVVNPLRKRLRYPNVAKNDDIGYLWAIKADGDIHGSDGSPRTLQSWHDARRKNLIDWCRGNAKYTLLVDSGGGAQLFGLFAEPIEVTGTNVLEAYHAHNQAWIEDLKQKCLATDVDWDSVYPAKNLMRLPYSRNMLSAKKKRFGRTSTLVATPIAITELRVSFDAPAAGTPSSAAPAVKLLPSEQRTRKRIEELGIGDKARKRLLALLKASAPGVDRSAELFKCELALARVGIDVEEAVVLLKCLKALAPKIAEKGDAWLRKDYERAIATVTPTYVAAYNRSHLVVVHGGKTTVCTEPAGPHLEFEMVPPEAFKSTDTRLVVDPYTRARMSQSESWLKSPLRRTYSGIELDPSQGRVTRSGRYNFWQGLAYEPSQQGDISAWKRHILEEACGGNQAYFDYLWRWMALGVQHPEKLPGVAIAMRGDEGVGKGIIAMPFVRLFGVHGRHLTDSTHVSSGFNSHMARLVALYIDEAIFAGDPAMADRVKGWITERQIAEHAKFKDIVYAVNRQKILISSNHRRVVPAGPAARRYFALAMAGAHIQQLDYFRPLFALFGENGRGDGYGRLLYELLNTKLEGFEVIAVPKTAELRDQQEQSLSDPLEWLLQALRTGRFGPDRQFAFEWGRLNMYARVPKQYCYEAFRKQFPFSRYAGNQITFSMEIRAFFKGTEYKGKPLVVRSGPKDWHDIGASVGDERAKKYTSECWLFAPLQECRAHFCKRMGAAFDDYSWPKPLPPENYSVADGGGEIVDDELEHDE